MAWTPWRSRPPQGSSQRAARALPEELPTQRELDLAPPIGEEPIVPHPLEATRQDMQEKAPNEFDRVKRHEALAIAPLIVFPSERHLAIVTGEEPPIGDGHAMRIAGQVTEDQLRPGQRRLGVDHPLRLLQARQELAPDRGSLPALALPLHAEVLLSGRLPQRRQEGAPKQPAEDPHRQEEALGTGDPRGAIQRQATCGDQAMDMGMMVQGLAPGMQDPEKPDLGA